MAQENDVWLAVIGKSLAYMCMRQAEKDDANRFGSVLAKVKFLENLGLPQDAAAEAAGSSAASVAVLRSLAKKKKARGKDNGVAKKTRG